MILIYIPGTAFLFIIYTFCLSYSWLYNKPLRLAPDHMTIQGRNLENGNSISQGQTSKSIEILWA
jgi:hypothetical protein